MRRLVREAARAARTATDHTLTTIETDFTAIAGRVAAVVQAQAPVTARQVERILELEAAAHTRAFGDAVRAVTRIDLSNVISQADVADEFAMIVRRNVGLIKNLSDDIANRVEQAVTRATLNGESASRLAETLREQFGIVGRRADLIARDQIATTTSDLNKLRQEQAGIAKYAWSTSADERVRPDHVALDGQVFKWDEPGPDNGLHPGQPINCRCVAVAVIE